MDRHAYIFIDRNFIGGNGRASPAIGVAKSWWFEGVVLPRISGRLNLRIDQLRNEIGEIGCAARLANGNVEEMVHACGRWAYGRRIFPDRESPDNVVQQQHRAATFDMFIIFGREPLFTGLCRPGFNAFVDYCFNLSKTITTSGIHHELQVEMPLKICKER